MGSKAELNFHKFALHFGTRMDEGSSRCWHQAGTCIAAWLCFVCLARSDHWARYCIHFFPLRAERQFGPSSWRKAWYATPSGISVVLLAPGEEACRALSRELSQRIDNDRTLPLQESYGAAVAEGLLRV